MANLRSKQETGRRGKCGGHAAWGILLISICLFGCGEAQPATRCAPESPATDDLGANFDACESAELSGRVIWTGELPVVPPFEIRSGELSLPALRESAFRNNPNVPVIDRDSRGVADAVIFLRGVDRRRCHAWDLPRVRVEQRGRQLHVMQGDVDSRVGFVRRGTAIEMVSTEPIFHALRGRGAAWFSLPFPDMNQPLTRSLHDKGIVELSSGAGYYWMRAYLFVDDHPYYARTDARGRFTLPQVPPGSYDLICWLPNWHEARRDRNPESSHHFRLEFKPPVTRSLRLSVESGDSLEMNFELSQGMFER